MSGERCSRFDTTVALVHLKKLGLGFTDVADLEPIRALTNLESLELTSSSIEDLSPLEPLKNLQVLIITDTPAIPIVTEEEVQAVHCSRGPHSTCTFSTASGSGMADTRS